MNRNITISLVFAVTTAAGQALAGTSLAGDISVESSPFVSTATRAEVQAQLSDFKKSGVNPWSTRYNPLSHFASQRSRAEVQAEYTDARDQIAAFTGEDSGSAYMAAHQYDAPVTMTVAGQSRNLK